MSFVFVTCDFRVLTFEFYGLGFAFLFCVTSFDTYILFLKGAIKNIKGSEVKQEHVFVMFQLVYVAL